LFSIVFKGVPDPSSLDDRLDRPNLGVLLDQALPLGDEAPRRGRLLGSQVTELGQRHRRTHSVAIPIAQSIGYVGGCIQTAIAGGLVDDLLFVSATELVIKIYDFWMLSYANSPIPVQFLCGLGVAQFSRAVAVLHLGVLVIVIRIGLVVCAELPAGLNVI